MTKNQGNQRQVVGVGLLVLVTQSCALTSAVRSPELDAVCYTLSVTDWRSDSGRSSTPRVSLDGAELQLVSKTLEPDESGFIWFWHGDSFHVSTASVMEGWRIRGRESDSGFSGEIDYFHDMLGNYEANITGEHSDCRSDPLLIHAMEKGQPLPGDAAGGYST